MEKTAIYFCPMCKNLVENLWNSDIEIVCCGKPMERLVANTVDAAVEKHVPVIERQGNTVVVKVGEVAHPMLPEHYILWAELSYGNTILRQDFVEGDSVAEARFMVDESVQNLKARIFCNLHGLWESK